MATTIRTTLADKAAPIITRLATPSRSTHSVLAVASSKTTIHSTPTSNTTSTSTTPTGTPSSSPSSTPLVSDAISTLQAHMHSVSSSTTPVASGSAPRRTRFVPTRHRRALTSAGAGESNNWAILFPGQGSQFVGMGKDLYDAYDAARKVVDEADDALEGTLKKVMFEGSQEELTRTENAQPAILTTSIAMLRVLETERDFKIDQTCKYALGHSLGEYSALVATGSLTLRDAVKLVRLRGEAMTKAVTNQRTAMSALVVRSSKLEELIKAMEEIQKSLPSGELAEIANINSTFQVVISGTVKGVDHASRALQAKKIAARAVDLPVSAPFHCTLMKPAADTMQAALKEVHFEKPSIKVISNVTAKPIEKVEDISDLLVRQVTGTVQWHDSIHRLRSEYNVHDYISFGPGKVLANLLRKEYPLDFVKTVTTVDDVREWTL